MINFGIIGFGLHAVKRLMPGFALAKNCRVTALSRRDLAKAQESARQYDIPLAFDSAEKLCRSPQVDAVFIATPNAFHLQDVLVAAACGKPILCEKPMAVNADQCRQMVEAARKAKVLLGVAQVFRFEDSTAWFREQVAAGNIGKPVFARSEFSFSAAHGHARTWINDPAIAGGGPVADVGVHCVDCPALHSSGRSTPSERSRDCRQSGQRGSRRRVVAGVLPRDSGHGHGFIPRRIPHAPRTGWRNRRLRADDALTVEHPVHLELRRGGAWS